MFFKKGFLIGTAQYPSLQILEQSILAAEPDYITVSLKRENLRPTQSHAFFDKLCALGIPLLPNTAGCRTASEAITVAHMAREIFGTSNIKLEVIGDDHLLAPDLSELLIAAEKLVEQNFTVFPYCTEDSIFCRKLYERGCHILMPWGSPIGSGLGLSHPSALKRLRESLPDATLVVDAGIGSPEHALQALLMGYDAVLINSAIAKAQDPVKMAQAFKLSVESGRLAYQAGLMPQSSFAQGSTSLTDTLFWSPA